MAATVAVLGTSVFTTTAGNKTITATPTAGDLIIIITAATGVATTMADNGTGGTYTQVSSTRTGFSTTGNLQMWVRDNLVSSATSTTYTATQTGSTGGGLVILRVTGMTVAGASAIRSSGGQSTGTAATTPAPVLSSTPLSTNPVISAVANASGGTTTLVPRTGYTEAFDNGYATPSTGLEVAYRASGETSATLTQGGTSATAFASIAAELVYDTAPTVALNAPADTATGQSTTPQLTFTGTDAAAQDITYEVQVDTVNTFVGQTSLIDSYSETNQDSNKGLTAATTGVAQSFTTSSSAPVVSATFYLKKSGSPTGTATAKVYATSSGVPIGAALANSDTFDVTTLSTSFALISFNFTGANIVSLVSSTTYAIAVETSGTSLGNTVDVGDDNSSATHAGISSTLSGGSYGAFGTPDFCFYVYAGVPLIDKLSNTDSGFIDITNGADTDPFASTNQIGYTVQAGDTLTGSTVYYWRVRGKDPTGTNSFGAWPTTRSFTTTSSTLTISTSDTATTSESTSVLHPFSTSISTGFSGTTTKTWQHMVYGTNPLLVMEANLWQDVAGTGTVTAASFNGVALTRVSTGTTNSAMRSEQWYLKAPPVGTYTMSVTVTGNTDAIKLAASTFDGYDQTSPLDNNSSATASAGDPSASVTTLTANALVVATLSRFSTTAATSNRTKVYNDSVTSVLGASSFQLATATGSYSDTYTGSAAQDWAMTIASYKPVSGTPADLTVSVSDSSTLTESVTVRPEQFIVSVSDSVTLTESVLRLTDNRIAVTDTATATEAVTTATSTTIAVSDSATLTEALQRMTENRIAVSDSSTLTEAITKALTPLLVSVSDSSTLTEMVSSLSTPNDSVNDAMTLTENVVVSIPVNVTVSDSATATESVTAQLTSDRAVNDTATLTESVALDIVTAGTNITVSDTATTSEAQQVQTLVSVSTTDTATTSESVTLQETASISTSDTATTSESLKLLTGIDIAKSDTATATESISFSTTNRITVSDSATLTENVERVATPNDSITDTLTVTETVSVVIPTAISKSDSLTASESLSVQITTAVNTSDTANVTESSNAIIAQAGTFIVSVNDNVTLLEATGALVNTQDSVNDMLLLTESIAVSIASGTTGEYKVRIGGVYTAKPVKVRIGGVQVVKPVKYKKAGVFTITPY